MRPQSAYPIPAEPGFFEEEIKKSRFLTYVAQVQGRDAAQAYIDEIRQMHPDARHHCWAFVAGRPDDGQQYGFSDDGEPSGTAGKPILSCLQGSGLGEVVAVVVRYSGGIKLGTGGLVRAYSNGPQQVLKQITTVQRVPMHNLLLRMDYSLQSAISMLLEQYQGQTVQVDYGAEIEMLVAVPQTELEAFRRDAVERTHGQLQILTTDPEQ